MRTSLTLDELESIYKECVRIVNSHSLSWEAKYDLIFSDNICQKTSGLFQWYDPDTSYEEDVKAFYNAFRDYMETPWKQE